MPVRPFRLAADGLHAGPGKAIAADADAVADGTALAEHIVERGVAGIDDDGTGRLGRTEGDDGAAKPLGRRALVGGDHLIGGITVRLGRDVTERLRVRSALETTTGVSATALTRTSALATRDESRRSDNCVMGLPRWMHASFDALHQQTRPQAGGSVRPALAAPYPARHRSRPPAGTLGSAPRYDAGPVRDVAVAVQRRFGRGKTIVSVIPTKPSPTKPSPAKPSSTRPLVAKSPPTTTGERQTAHEREGVPVPNNAGELPPVIRRTEVVAIALVSLLVICIIAGLYLARAFFCR